MNNLENKDMDELTHSIEITITGVYPQGQKQHAKVEVSGDGGLDHMIEAFKVSLVASGFSPETAASLDRVDT